MAWESRAASDPRRVAFACTCTAFALLSFLSTSSGLLRSPFFLKVEKITQICGSCFFQTCCFPWSCFETFLEFLQTYSLTLKQQVSEAAIQLKSKLDDIWSQYRSFHYFGKCWEAWRQNCSSPLREMAKNCSCTKKKKLDLLITIIVEVPGVMFSISQEGALIPNNLSETKFHLKLVLLLGFPDMMKIYGNNGRCDSVLMMP